MGDNSYCAIGFLPAFPRHPRGILCSLKDMPCGQRQLKATKTKKDYVEVNGGKQLLARNLR